MGVWMMLNFITRVLLSLLWSKAGGGLLMSLIVLEGHTKQRGKKNFDNSVLTRAAMQVLLGTDAPQREGNLQRMFHLLQETSSYEDGAGLRLAQCFMRDLAIMVAEYALQFTAESFHEDTQHFLAALQSTQDPKQGLCTDELMIPAMNLLMKSNQKMVTFQGLVKRVQEFCWGVIAAAPNAELGGSDSPAAIYQRKVELTAQLVQMFVDDLIIRLAARIPEVEVAEEGSFPEISATPPVPAVPAPESSGVGLRDLGGQAETLADRVDKALTG